MMNVALLGFGVVGTGVYRCLQGQRDVTVKRVLDLRSFPEYGSLVTANFDEIVSDPEISVVVEAMGGLHPAYEYACACLKAGKHYVSANKQMISRFYEPLMKLAAENGVCLRFTPAAGGGIPWLFSLNRTKRCDEILKMQGILNGTSNFILDSMESDGTEFDEALRQAQALGYAEKDPAADIDGWDLRAKCALSAMVAFDGILNPEEIPVFGIRSVRKRDFELLGAEGRTLRFLFTVVADGCHPAAFVQPFAVRKNSLFASVKKNFNLVSLEGKNVGPLSFYGQGAGSLPTGSSLAQDVLDLAAHPAASSVPHKRLTVDSSSALYSYYIRTSATLPPDFAQVVLPDMYRTKKISVEKMHLVAATLPPDSFIAAVEE